MWYCWYIWNVGILITMKEISVCIVDDNRELRNALEEIISMSEGYLCIGTIGTAEDAINQLPILQPEVVLMDINLGTEQSGIDVVRVLKPQMPDTNFMMCTVYEEDDKIFPEIDNQVGNRLLKKI